MNILFAASELAPYAKTGGLGDVVASLPAALNECGHTVSVVIPLYRSVREQFKGLKKSELHLNVALDEEKIPVPVWQGTTEDGVAVFAVQRDEFFDRAGLYGNEEGDYADSAARFAFFSRAVVELALYLEPQMDVIHAHDWHAALVPAYVRAWSLPFKTVLTVHNLAYQGVFPAHAFAHTDLPREYFSPEGIEFYGHVNFLKGGMMLAHAVTTVSPTYAREIQREEYGCGLHDVLAAHQYKLTGILNGIDTTMWNPADDPFLAASYSAEKPEGKAKCKADLLKTLQMKGGADKPLIGMVSRLVEQKGVDLVLDSVEEILKRDIRLVVLGVGEKRYENAFTRLARKCPNQLKVKIGFDEKLAHQIEAGSDFFLMPSEFEPCGLNQFYSLRYGTIPIARDTGGLSDSITDWNGKEGTGFKFAEGTPAALLKKVDEALAVMKDPAGWAKLKGNAMRQDHSWQARVGDYEKLYEQLLKS
ncbi:MAG: glycogen synthase GlgA [bacterium]